MLQDLDQAATGLGGLCVDKADNGILQIILVNFTQIIHGIRLCIIQEFEKHFPVNSKQTVKVGCFADNIAIILA